MTDKQAESSPTLRRQAEEKLTSGTPATQKVVSLDEANRLLHELQVHQIELEMQNEELRRAQAELDAVRARYFELYDLQPVGYCTISEKGLIQEANRPAATLLGVTRGALAKQPISRFILNKEDKDSYYLHHKQCFESSAPQAWEMRLLRADGSLFWAQLRATPAPNGDSLVVFTDITVRKQAEDALAMKKNHLLALMQTIPDLVWLKDINGVYVNCNRQFERLFGASEADIIGKTDYDFVDKDLADFFRKNDQQAILAGKPSSNEEWITFADDGQKALLETIKTPMYNPAGEIIGVLGIARDITKRNQAEDALHKKNVEVEQFLYTVSHDLRGPLVTVKTFLGFLEKDLAGNDQGQASQDIQFIHNAADKMKLLMDELLELSRIDHVETQSVKVSLSEVVDEVMESLAGVIYECKVDIKRPDTDLILFGGRPRLCQLWQNLIENAIKYSSRDGIIPRIELGIRKMDGETVFFVKDNGIGIDSQYYGKIFGIFEKLNPKSPGAGMGLSMIRRIVEKCGGRVWVESEGSDKGSCFFFTLPHVVVQS